ncbi:MAG: magnesium/cobalt transporter CorA [Methylococcaceae bacterium]|nr:magnesium/cobalt transporter CorA [Methylococcaceae bacterium]MDZ4155766.1 magnesium/cobalt transporter CorA [Methylococcales bacterium]MDP2391885.1 magnesium/cobalt transporter CorA [Methylococcaceae bacterium]MDP3018876.1 magnesium/cobalt transporter CorA [Methylococcaceae bacterium]MDP3391437.1 magnesium/cobalt transporter CorA [Methylococcaceae bacterium]
MANTIDNCMVMKCVAYQNGASIGDVTIEDISEVLKRDNTFIWLGLREVDKELLLKIQEEFGLHELAVEDACVAHQRPKIEEFGDSLFIVLHTAHLAEEGVEFGETHIFMGPRFLVTVRHGSSLSHNKIRGRCEAMPQQLAKGPGFALYSIMDFIVDNYLPVIDGLQARFDALESAIFQYKPGRLTMEGLYELKRELLLLESAITPVIDICNELMRFHDSGIPKDVRVYFRDVADHVKRIHQAIHAMREMLVAAMQVHLTFETVRQNEVVKRLAGWGAILAIPTMVFSWYGMNFRHMPELDWEYSYPAVVIGVAVGSMLLYWRLRKSGWL